MMNGNTFAPGNDDARDDDDDGNPVDEFIDEDEIKNKNIYKFKKDDVKKQHDRVKLDENIISKIESPSSRHRGLPPIMTAILSMIHRASRIAEKRGEEFIGLTLFECQTIFNPCNISPDTIRENMRKLWKNLNMLKQTKVRKTEKTVLIYYNINRNKFPCKDGTFLLSDDEGIAGSFMFPVGCQYYPFCACNPTNCNIVDQLSKLRDLLVKLGDFKSIKAKIDKWQVIENDISSIEEHFFDHVKETGIIRDEYLRELSDAEVRYHAERLYAAKETNRFSVEANRIRKEIIELFDTMINDHVARVYGEEKGKELLKTKWKEIFKEVMVGKAKIKKTSRGGSLDFIP
jgi:hypothetical protein